MGFNDNQSNYNHAIVKPNLFKRLCLAIPFIRHKIALNIAKENIKSDNFNNIANRTISCMIAPNMVELYTDGKFDAETFGKSDYYKNILTNFYGKNGKYYAQKIKIEKAKIRNRPDILIWLVHLPSNCEAGQSEVVAFVINGRKACTYCWEWSFNKNKVIGTWNEKNHYNLGICDDKVGFVKKIASLSQEHPSNEEDGLNDFGKLDAKHRLANEIGIRVEMLDFYMQKFNEMLVNEIHGVDSSGINNGIENEDEWIRYCTWEINQAKKRMSDEDLMQSKKLFDMMIERDKRGQ